MTKSKNTKRALLTSVLSLMLCAAMLIGSTFAWFTDSVTSGKNRIVAGNLDVELFYKNASTAGQLGGWQDATTDNPTFFVDKVGGDIRWEPGVMAVTHFKVANRGTLALKYRLETINAGSNSLNNHNLSEVIKIAVVEGERTYTNRAEVEALEFKDFTEFTAVGSLLPADPEEIFTVVAYWAPGDNDNLYNVNNGQLTSDGKDHLYIDIEIQLTATQFTHENDSFDNQYDAEAWSMMDPAAHLEALVNQGYIDVETADALRSALEGTTAPNGKVVMSGDVTVEDGTQISVLKDTVIDFNGNTLIGTLENGSYLKDEPNVNLVLSDPMNDGSKYTIDGAIVVDENHGMTQFAGVSAWKPTVTIESGRYTHNNAVVHCQLQTDDPTAVGVVINGGTFDGKGAASVVADIIGTVIINDGTFNAHKDVDAFGECVYLDFGDTDVPTITIINGGTFNAESRQFFIKVDSKYTQKLEVKGGTFNVAAGGSLVETEGGSAEGILVITGGTFNVDPSAYVPETHQVQPNDDGTWTVTAISIDEAEEPDPFA